VGAVVVAIVQVLHQSGNQVAKEAKAAQAMLGQLEFIARKMGRVREFFGGFAEEESADSQELEAARRELKQLLREKRGASAAEKTRIAAILKGAAAQIRGG